MQARAVCDTCGQACISKGGGVGYGIDRDTQDRICYRCCGIQDTEAMVQDGRAVLYLSSRIETDAEQTMQVLRSGLYPQEPHTVHEVTNWPGSLRFSVWGPTKGRHNIARTRYDIWFIGPDAEAWWGVQYGEWTQICHCKRLKPDGEAARGVKRWALRTGQLRVKDQFTLGQSALEVAA